MSSEQAVLIRPATAADIPRVVRQWLSSYRNSKWAGVVPNNLYKKVYAETIRQLLARGAQLGVACNPDVPDQILGFICYEHTPRDRIVHYIFVRSIYRGAGLATALLAAAGINKGTAFVYTFRTSESSLFTGGTYLPDLARRRVAWKADPTEEPGELN